MIYECDDTDFDEGVITAVDTLLFERGLPGPGECCWDKQAHWLMEELCGAFDVFDKARGYGHPDQQKAPMRELARVLRRFRKYVNEHPELKNWFCQLPAQRNPAGRLCVIDRQWRHA